VKRRNGVLAIAVVALLTVSLFLGVENFLLPKNRAVTPSEFYVGVECGYNNVTLCKELINKVKDYTNLFIIGSTDIVKNTSLLDDVVDYAYQAGMYISVYFSPTQNYSALSENTSVSAQSTLPLGWLKNATSKYGDRLVGAYVFDEPGGNQLDGVAQKNKTIYQSDYQNLTNVYVSDVGGKIQPYQNIGVMTFTSDYGLYWFDYKAGYYAIFAELGGNNGSRQLPISLCRGAATAQGKEWGVMVTTRFYDGRILESGPELYEDLVLGYNSGAKFAVVFDYALTVSASGQEMVAYQSQEYGILQHEHFEALKNFWVYTHQNPERHGSVVADVALVVPQNLGFGFRNAWDTVWGAKGDALSQAVWADTDKYMNQYGDRVDIVYNDHEFTGSIKTHYTTVIEFPNGTAKP
jgi:hypothetical protein